MVKAAQNKNHPLPSCRLNTLAGTEDWILGQGTSRRANHANKSTGASTSGQLNRNAPRVSKDVLNRTHISAGKTFTCRMAGTAKLFKANTKVRTAAWAKLVRARGKRRARIKLQPVTAGSISSCAASNRRHALQTNNKEMGQVRRLRIQIVPPRETILNGSQARQTPV